MKIITKLEDLKNKTIKDAKQPGDEIIVIFDDDTYCGFESSVYYDGDAEVNLSTDVTPSDKLQAGIISQDEYDTLKRNAEQKTFDSVRAQELAQLNRLQKKYQTRDS